MGNEFPMSRNGSKMLLFLFDIAINRVGEGGGESRICPAEIVGEQDWHYEEIIYFHI